MFSLTDKVALVTGGASGIGEAIAEVFAGAGAMVYVADRDAAGEKTAARIEAGGGKARFIQLDITDGPACGRVVELIMADHQGRLDVLVNNAGIGKVGTLLETSAQDMQRILDVNLMGAFHLCKAALPGMIARRAGSIINIASLAGLIGIPDRLAYTTSKFAVVGLTKAMAMDHSHTRVRVNCICPGRIQTPFVEQRLKEYPDPEQFKKQMIAPHPIGRLGEPREIAAAALYLASDESAFVTGSSMSVDGGYTAGK